jgi:endonuclease/exonuclease/phosphatase family metal-dependent hydrolase
LEAEIRLPDEAGTLAVPATHLDFRPDDSERLESVRVISALVAASRESPALIAGDLNASPDSTALRALEVADWTRANIEILPTSPVVNPQRQIDYGLYRPSDRWRVVEVRALGEAVASDHRPILAVFKFLSQIPAK